VEVYPEYAQGLQDLEGFSHIILFYVINESSGYTLLSKPFLDDKLHGLFATRYPFRTNRIGLSVVRLTARQGDTLEIEGWICWMALLSWISNHTWKNSM
jgi:tRNA (Thr-GGU) A37 N-methylase